MTGSHRMTRRLATGVLLSLPFTATNPEAAVKIDYSEYPQLKLRGVSDDEAVAQGTAAVKLALKDYGCNAGKWGQLRGDAIENYAKLLGVDTKILDIDALYTNQLIDQINDFDAQTVIDMAKNYK